VVRNVVQVAIGDLMQIAPGMQILAADRSTLRPRSLSVTSRRLSALGLPQYRQVPSPTIPAGAFSNFDEQLTGLGIPSPRRQGTSRCRTEREERMPPLLNEALEWLDRAEQAREVAGQLADPGAKQAVLALADSFDRLARAAASPAVAGRRELARQTEL
jgi:hypothetical protein